METGLWIAPGYGIVVGIDLEKFLDRVNHVSLMRRAAKRVRQRTTITLRHLRCVPISARVQRHTS